MAYARDSVGSVGSNNCVWPLFVVKVLSRNGCVFIWPSISEFRNLLILKFSSSQDKTFFVSLAASDFLLTKSFDLKVLV